VFCGRGVSAEVSVLWVRCVWGREFFVIKKSVRKRVRRMFCEACDDMECVERRVWWDVRRDKILRWGVYWDKYIWNCEICFREKCDMYWANLREVRERIYWLKSLRRCMLRERVCEGVRWEKRVGKFVKRRIILGVWWKKSSRKIVYWKRSVKLCVLI
jgi:hypothetical protein